MRQPLLMRVIYLKNAAIEFMMPFALWAASSGNRPIGLCWARYTTRSSTTAPATKSPSTRWSGL
jgi:hypothetical protein